MLRATKPNNLRAPRDIIITRLRLITILLTLVPCLVHHKTVRHTIINTMLMNFGITVVTLTIRIVRNITRHNIIISPMISGQTRPSHTLLVAAILSIMIIRTVIFISLRFTHLKVRRQHTPMETILIFILVLRHRHIQRI